MNINQSNVLTWLQALPRFFHHLHLVSFPLVLLRSHRAPRDPEKSANLLDNPEVKRVDPF